MSDIAAQFARLWGQHEVMVINAKDDEIAKMLKGYDSYEMSLLIDEWVREYLLESDIEDTVDFFESKIEQMYKEEI